MAECPRGAQEREMKLEKVKERRRFWFFGGDLRPDPPKSEGFKNAKGTPPCQRAVGAWWRSEGMVECPRARQEKRN